MPCRSDDRYDCDSSKPELDKVTRLLCDVCKHLEKGHSASFIFNSPSELSTWWKKHQAEDQKREAVEKAEALKEQKKRDALNKLTDEEKKLLGIK